MKKKLQMTKKIQIKNKQPEVMFSKKLLMNTIENLYLIFLKSQENT